MTETRLVEIELEESPVLWLVAGALFGALEDEDNPSNFLDAWQRYVAELSLNPHWQDGRHSGDCTRLPATCFRCLVEEYTDKAKLVLAKQRELEMTDSKQCGGQLGDYADDQAGES